MKFRTRLASLNRVLQGITLGTLAAMLMTSNLRAQAPAKPAEPAAPTIGDLGSKQEANAKKFQEFKEGLFRLAKRLEKSDRAEDKETAKIILSAIDAAQKSGVDSQFQKLVLGLKAGNLAVNDLQKLEGEGQQLSKMLKEIYDILMTDDEAAKLKAEIARLEAILKNAKDIKNTQERLQDNTQSKIGKSEDLSKQQDKLKDRTEDLAQQMGGKPKEGKPGEQAPKKDDRAENKPEPKPGESVGEMKPEGNEEKGGPKDSDPMGKEGDPKEGAGEPKEGKGDPKAGEPKEGKGDPKEGGEPKPGEPKGGEPKPGEPKPGEPKDPMGGGKDPMAGKPGESKEGKPGEGKSGKGEAKPGDPKAGEGKGQNAPPMGGGKPSESKPGGGEPKPGEPGQPGQPGGGQPPPKETPGRKEVQDALPYQDNAKKDLDKDNRNNAGKNQDKATENLAKAIEELEKRLKQLREEELKKLLANVEARVGKMLQMQIDVYNATVAIDGAIAKNGGMKTVADTQKAQQQGDKEQEIVAEADRALKLLESEGSAVAFARVLEEVRQDMIAVQFRLSKSVVNAETQEIEKNIIDMLTEMKEALKKAQKDKEKTESEPKDGKSGENKPQNKKLIDLIAELKLIRSMQVQVNKRTEMHGKKVDQAADPLIQAEIRQLSARQAKLQDMLEKIAAGANQ
jgi:hypothetical protein